MVIGWLIGINNVYISLVMPQSEGKRERGGGQNSSISLVLNHVVYVLICYKSTNENPTTIT